MQRINLANFILFQSDTSPDYWGFNAFERSLSIDLVEFGVGVGGGGGGGGRSGCIGYSGSPASGA